MPEYPPNSKATKITSLKKRYQFIHVAEKGKKIITKSLIVQGCPSAEDCSSFSSSPRFGLIVTKRNGNAVERNRIKRRLRALIREILKQNYILPLDYVIISRPGCLTEPFHELEQMLRRALKKYKDLFNNSDDQ